MEKIVKLERVDIVVTSCEKSLSQVKLLTHAPLICNGGFFEGSRAVCHLKVDGDVLARDKYTYWGYSWNEGELPSMSVVPCSKDNYIAAVCMVRDGKAEEIYYNPDVGGSRQRTAFGRMPDGSFYWLCDKHGRTPEELRSHVLSVGVMDCLMLDGGGSTQGSFDNELVVSSRDVQNWLCGFTGNPYPRPTHTPKYWTRDEIRWIQWQLRKKGYYTDKIDGSFGPLSTEAWNKYLEAK